MSSITELNVLNLKIRPELSGLYMKRIRWPKSCCVSAAQQAEACASRRVREVFHYSTTATVQVVIQNQAGILLQGQDTLILSIAAASDYLFCYCENYDVAKKYCLLMERNILCALNQAFCFSTE